MGLWCRLTCRHAASDASQPSSHWYGYSTPSECLGLHLLESLPQPILCNTDLYAWLHFKGWNFCACQLPSQYCGAGHVVTHLQAQRLASGIAGSHTTKCSGILISGAIWRVCGEPRLMYNTHDDLTAACRPRGHALWLPASHTSGRQAPGQHAPMASQHAQCSALTAMEAMPQMRYLTSTWLFTHEAYPREMTVILGSSLALYCSDKIICKVRAGQQLLPKVCQHVLAGVMILMSPRRC